jgi:hypothetical protein
MRVDWKTLKKFIEDTSLYHYTNYLEFPDETFVWISYQNQNFECLLSKGSQDFNDFDVNFKSKAVLKDDISNDGRPFARITHVKEGRYLHDYFVEFETSSKIINDNSGIFYVKLFDENGHETDDGTQAVKTCINFEPNYTYELYGGGLETIDTMTEVFYASAIINPDVPENQGGNFVKIRNKRLLQPKENIFKSGFGTVEMKYIEGYHTNAMRVDISHVKGIKQKFQYEVQFYL